MFILQWILVSFSNSNLQPQAHSWYTSNAKLSGSLGGEFSPKNDLHRRSASLWVGNYIYKFKLVFVAIPGSITFSYELGIVFISLNIDLKQFPVQYTFLVSWENF